MSVLLAAEADMTQTAVSSQLQTDPFFHIVVLPIKNAGL
jgi:hypothetical protein